MRLQEGSRRFHGRPGLCKWPPRTAHEAPNVAQEGFQRRPGRPKRPPRRPRVPPRWPRHSRETARKSTRSVKNSPTKPFEKPRAAQETTPQVEVGDQGGERWRGANARSGGGRYTLNSPRPQQGGWRGSGPQGMTSRVLQTVPNPSRMAHMAARNSRRGPKYGPGGLPDTYARELHDGP